MMLQVEYRSLEDELKWNPVIRDSPALKMPVDFAAYLLSSSPPGFEFYTLRDGSLGFGKVPACPKRPVCPAVKSLIQRSQSDMCLTSRGRSQDSQSDVDNSNSDSEICYKLPRAVPHSYSTPKLSGKKSVSFADEMGYQLTHVRVMTEGSSTPPRIKPEVLARITQGAKVEPTTSSSSPLVLAFQQPASDYIAFRERLERDSVSLENVILRDYNVMGTVKVKNVSFEKVVKVRVTFDLWETFTDILAEFVPSQQSSMHLCSPYDTFSFQINVPPDLGVEKTVEFAVCYEANSQQFWDNNSGANYRVHSAKLTSDEKPHSVFNMSHDTDWTEYSSWNYLDSSVPYY